MAERREILILAGKRRWQTTFATEYLPNEQDCLAFVNADSIAAGLSPVQQSSMIFRAGRLLLETIHDHVASGRNFAFEQHYEEISTKIRRIGIGPLSSTGMYWSNKLMFVLLGKSTDKIRLSYDVSKNYRRERPVKLIDI